MYWVMALAFLGLPIGLGVFLSWRAYQLAIKRRASLTHQWLAKPPPGIERCATLFAIRDLIFALGCFLFVGLLMAWPALLNVWIPLLAAFGGIHQCITEFAKHKLSKANRR